MVFGIVCPLLGAVQTQLTHAQPAAMILKPGVVRLRPQVEATETQERSIYRSPNFIRLLGACFIVSYPFFIPAFVSRPSDCCTTYADELLS